MNISKCKIENNFIFTIFKNKIKYLFSTKKKIVENVLNRNRKYLVYRVSLLNKCYLANIWHKNKLIPIFN